MQRWDIFCRVIDNYGDIGVCWRLAQELADEHDAEIRLWVDNLESFQRICAAVSTEARVQRVGHIDVRHWQADFPEVEAADVVIEAFACELPASYIDAMAVRNVPPVWINLEYLSAETWVDDCHLLRSPHPTRALTKHFFFPGFTSQTGGVLRERDLLTARTAFDSAAQVEFWQRLETITSTTNSVSERIVIPSRVAGELRISLFCYENSALPELLQCWSEGPSPVRLLAAPGAATEQIARWFECPFSPGTPLQRDFLTVHALPFLPQTDYDRLLWACDVNFVRGEDSFVRAQWAQQPFVWQIYPQTENAHLAKLDAFLTRYLDGFPDSDIVRRCWHAWNGTGNIGAVWREFVANRLSIQQHGKVWALHLDRAGNLANNLVRFVREW